MQFDVITNPTDLAALRGEWNGFAVPSPMQSLEWLATWWDVYANGSRELFVVVARDGEELTGVAPWYVERRLGKRIVRSLGDGRVCSDHTTLLARPAYRQQFSSKLAGWLLDAGRQRWHELKLESIDLDDAACEQLTAALARQSCPSIARDQPGSCYVDLPTSYDDYLMSVSKNHRKRCRKWDKQFFQTGRAKVYVAVTPDDCLAAWQTLVDLHNTRRTNLGEQGAFEDRQFAEFHRIAIPRLSAAGRLQIRLLEVDRQVVAAEYVLQDQQAWYAYQSGLSPAGEELSAGSLSILSMVQDAISSGCPRLDLLRGDEPYKFSWGAVHRPAHSVTLRQPTSAARLATLRDTAWLAAKKLKHRLATSSP